MLKVTVLGYSDVVEQVTDDLQRAGLLQIEKHESDQGGVTEMVVDQQRLHIAEKLLAQAQFVRDFLYRYHEADVAFGVFISEKFHLSEEEFHALEPDAKFEELYQECERASDRIATIDRERARLTSLVHELEPWRDMRLQISQWEGTEHVALFTGIVPLNHSADVRTALREAVDEVSVDEVGNDGHSEAWVVMAHISRLEEVKSALAATEFAEVSFPELVDYPAEEIADALELLGNLEREKSELEDRARELAHEYANVFALVEALHSDLEAVSVHSCYLSTERTFVLTGWLPERKREALLAALEPVGSDIDVSFEQPDPSESVPVELTNHSWIRPFEVLTDLYGRPDYFGFDPTPIMAPFFFWFFGMCIGDVGYGIMLMVGAWLIKTKLDVAPGVKKFMDLLIFGGFASVLWGALTRSYLAFAADKLPAFLQYKPLIDPATELILLLSVCVVIGVVHVSVAIALAAYQEWHRGNVIDSISDHISLLVFLALLIVAVLSMAGMLNSALGMPLLIVAFVQLLLLKGGLLNVIARKVPAWHTALIPLKGFLGVYGVVGLGSEFLSYTRLAALGLASLYVGDAMNRLTELSGGIPYIGIFIAALIFVVGHVFNVVINLLGAFVHPTRLQYVEFFGHFYEGGGRVYTPFSSTTRQLVLHPQAAGEQKGGPSS